MLKKKITRPLRELSGGGDTLKLTILGCYGPYAPKDGACSGYLIESQNIKLMLDCGHGAFAQLQKFINFRDLHCLVISHFHPDHYGDIHGIRHAFKGSIRDGSRQNPLVVYAPSNPAHLFEEISSWVDTFVVIPIEDTLSKTNPVGDLKIRFFPTNHPLVTYGVQAEFKNKTITYTSDTGWDSALIDICWQSDLLLTEASLRNVDIAFADKGHMTAKQAGILGQKSQAKKLVITHFWPEFNLYQLKREAEVGYEAQVDLAQMGKTFIVNSE